MPTFEAVAKEVNEDLVRASVTGAQACSAACKLIQCLGTSITGSSLGRTRAVDEVCGRKARKYVDAVRADGGVRGGAKPAASLTETRRRAVGKGMRVASGGSSCGVVKNVV